MSYLFTSESVTSGHPDKLCDYISDSILDACLDCDANARVAVEVFVKGLDDTNNGNRKSVIVIGGEITMENKFDIDFEKIARDCAINIGYSDIETGMDASNNESCEVILLISQQSEEISQGVSNNSIEAVEQGAGDQGIIFGYATNESENYKSTKGFFMPLPILLAHRITQKMEEKRKDGGISWARPDGKSQVTVEYDNNGKPIRINTIIIAIQHEDMLTGMFDKEYEERNFILNEITEKIVKKEIPIELLDDDIRIIVNGTGRFCKGGPHADAGLTGRKVIVDTYGGSGRHGGGAFSGKDPSKVDRSAAYAARWICKNIVASGLAERCEIQISYSIGHSNPISINLDAFGTSIYSNSQIKNFVVENFDFRPSAIIRLLNLKNSIYAKTSSGGHFGRIPENGFFTWEKIDKTFLNTIREHNW
jgi:S-adenosylmethionine synthetase